MVTRREFLANLFAAVPALAVAPFVKPPLAAPIKVSAHLDGKQIAETVIGRHFIRPGDRVKLLDTGQIVTFDKAGHPIAPGDILVRRDDGLLYPFNHPQPFAGVATAPALAGECVEYVEARQ